MPQKLRDNRALGVGAGIAGIAGVALLDVAFSLPAAVPALLLLIPVAAGTTLGNRQIGTVVAVLAALSFAVFSVEPIGSPIVRVGADIAVLATFIVVAVAVSYLTNRRSIHDQDVLDTQRIALLSSVSHDLRSPLTTIRAISSELLSTDAGDDATARERMLNQVVDESERLDRIVGNLLSTIRIQTGVFEPSRRPEPLADIVAIAVKRLTRGDEPQRIEVEVPSELPEVEVDPVQLDQVLTNLLENASRHGMSSEPVRVLGRWPSPTWGEPFVEVTVADSGGGFSDTARARLFEPFNTTVSRSDSTGLGLAVCRAIVDAHGGTIWLRDQAGPGAAISFTLPVAATGSDSAGRG
ncbi:MAG: ATP-binding protein [Ilumatobacter sp.]|uniref:sensor histidine kinase n=1 Tax=Ilumatobacter sp. TaxID=1967498 RepID=UPI003298D881